MNANALERAHLEDARDLAWCRERIKELEKSEWLLACLVDKMLFLCAEGWKHEHSNGVAFASKEKSIADLLLRAQQHGEGQR